MLRCGWLEWPWARDSFVYAPDFSILPFFPVLLPGGMSVHAGGGAHCCVAMRCFCLCVAGSFTVFTVGFCYIVDWVFLFTACMWFFHCNVGVHCKALVVLLTGLRIAISLQ